MKHLTLTLLILLAAFTLHAQDMKNFKLYKPAEDAEKALTQKINEAKASGKNVFVQIGGNWCIWCARFHDFITQDASIDSLVKANYIVYHMNFSQENENDKLMARFGYPQRFGFPVFIILDAKGNRLHTQNSAYLEEGKGYSKRRVTEFFENWSPKALDPASYKKK